MAENMSNDDLQVIVDSYKRVQMERSQADALKHMEGRWGRVCHAVQRVVEKFMHLSMLSPTIPRVAPLYPTRGIVGQCREIWYQPIAPGVEFWHAQKFKIVKSHSISKGSRGTWQQGVPKGVGISYFYIVKSSLCPCVPRVGYSRA